MEKLNEEAVFIISNALGEQVCVSGVLNQYYKENNKKLYIITCKPSLFVGQPYCKEVIDIDFLNGEGGEEQFKFFKKFKKIHSLFYQTDKHLKGENTIIENFCEQMNVSKVKNPFFTLNPTELKNFSLTDKPYILVSLKPHGKYDIINRTLKYMPHKRSLEIILNLKKDIPTHEIIDLSDIKTNNLKDLIFAAAKCDTFLSVNTSLQHLTANKPFLKKGVVLWCDAITYPLHGYEHNINLISNFIHPYDKYDIIFKNLKSLLIKNN
jgi:hypothetical protein